jgi:uncharacterized protein (DUF924 family)
MTIRALTGLLLCLAIAACSGPAPRPAADPAAMAHGAAVTPAADTTGVETPGVEKRHREAWLAQTDPAALDVLRFWFEEWDEDRVQGGKGRYNDKWFPHGPLGAAGSAEIDREIRERYAGLFGQAVAGELDWAVDENPYENLAFILLIDQFARNMFRGTPQAYEHDALGLAAARTNVEKGFYRYYFTGYQKLFVVYPLMHHESLDSQDKCMFLLKAINESQDHPYQFLNAMYKGMEHRQVIFMFGRFPHRNERLGRETTPMERAYLDMKGTKGFIDGSKW